MDGNTLQKIRDELLKRRRQIVLGTSIERKMGSAEMGTEQAEIIDLAQAQEETDREASLAEQERRELMNIDRALARMATGTYGFCEECNEEIPAKRLIAIPHARLCARCQTLEEKHQGRMRGTQVRGTGVAL